jgi:CDP-diglyceride synthetase
MNEEELKDIWNADQSGPAISYAVLQTSLQHWNDGTRRKVQIETWVQIATVVLNFIPAIFYPKWIVFALGVAALGIWYIPELRRFSKPEMGELSGDVRQMLDLKILTMRRYFRHTRIALYAFAPMLVPAALYGIGYFDDNENSLTARVLWTVLLTLICEAAIVALNEIFFLVVYKPALKELENLSKQLKPDE